MKERAMNPHQNQETPHHDDERSMDRTVNVSIQNATGRLRIVVFEPSGREFLLTLNEKLEVAIDAGSEGPDIRLVESGNRTLVFVAGHDAIRVSKGDATYDLEPIVDVTGIQDVGPGVDPLWDRDLDG
jgi:hypothetical protein